MLTQHTKIKQLIVASQKVSSNNDLLLVEKHLNIHLNGTHYSDHIIPQWLEWFIQGRQYQATQSLARLALDTPEHGPIHATALPNDPYTLNALPVSDLTIQPDMMIDWVRQFKSDQVLYHQTGATESAGILLDNQSVLTVECLTFKSAFTKLLGAIIKKDVSFYPIILASPRIGSPEITAMKALPPHLLIGQSAITATAVSQLIMAKCTVFGFCRKRKFNRYSNFHL
ncbi:MAG: formate dehydrogenase accessory sulfurtransferase FdhD [Candidatus Marinamargulisbacteria bacterium]